MGHHDTLDVPSDTPRTPLPIQEVGSTKHKIYVTVKDELAKMERLVCLLCSLEVGLALPPSLRGIHASRVHERIHDVSSSPHDSLPDFSAILAREIYESQPCESSFVKLSAEYLYETSLSETHHANVQSLTLLCRATFDGQDLMKSVGMDVSIMMACPCSQRYYAKMFSERNPDSLSDRHASLLTHTQRGSLRIVVENLSSALSYRQLLEVVEETAVLTYWILKRPEEIGLFMRSVRSAQFVEDLARAAAWNTSKRIRNKDRDTAIIDARVVSFESVHPFNLFAHVRMPVKEIMLRPKQ